MAEDRDRTPRPGVPGTTSDPNQSNREPTRDRGAEQVRKAPDDSDGPAPPPRRPRAEPD